VEVEDTSVNLGAPGDEFTETAGASSTGRGGNRITLIAIHTNEGPNPADVFPDRTAENLARWMDGHPVSYHKIVDDDSVVHYVPDERYSWSLRSGNPRSLNLCFTGYARWTRAEWLRHDRMLRMGADVVRGWSRRYGVPLRKLTSAEVGGNQSGVIGHVNWTLGKRDGSHTDPGDGFPWDIFMRYCQGAPPQEEDDFMASLNEAEKAELFAKIREIHQRETQPLDFRGHHGEAKDNQQGQELSVRKELTWLREQVNRIEALLTPKAPGS